MNVRTGTLPRATRVAKNANGQFKNARRHLSRLYDSDGVVCGLKDGVPDACTRNKTEPK